MDRGFLGPDTPIYQHFFISRQPDQSPEPKLSRVELSLEPSPKPSQDEPSRAPNEVVPSRAEPSRAEPSRTEPGAEPSWVRPSRFFSETEPTGKPMNTHMLYSTISALSFRFCFYSKHHIFKVLTVLLALGLGNSCGSRVSSGLQNYKLGLRVATATSKE